MEENPIPEAIEQVKDAIENIEEEVPKVPSRFEKLKPIASLLASLAALLTAAGALLKTCDHSLTEDAYNTLSKEISTLSDQQQKTHEDIASLQGYLDGLSHAPLIPPVPPSASALASSSAVPSASSAPSNFALRPATHPTATAVAKTPDGGLITFDIVSPPPLPSVHAPSAPVKPPDWDTIDKSKW